MDDVLNWLTQGLVLGVSTAAGLRLIPRTRAQSRYIFLWAAYLSLVTLPAVAPILMVTGGAAGVDVATVMPEPLLAMPPMWMSWMSTRVTVALWLVWFAVNAVALGRDFAGAQRAKRNGQPYPLDLLSHLPHWSRVSATGRPMGVVLSNAVHGAGVLSGGTPVIAISPRLVEELGVSDLDRVLVHEWAHVQRRDDLVHVVQRIVRAFVGWHPVAWWLERRLDLEREVACDEIAVRLTGSAKGYAECLVTIAALHQRPQPTVTALAVASRSRLHERVKRIVTAPTAPLRPWRALGVAAALCVTACALLVGNVHVVATASPVAVLDAAATLSAGAAAITASRAPAARERSVSISASPQPRRPPARARVSAREAGKSEETMQTHPSQQPRTTAFAVVAIPWTGVSRRAKLGEAPPPFASVEQPIVAAPPSAPQDSPTDASAEWTRPADVGVTIGRASQTAGVATAGFFSRFGKKLARSF